MSLSDNTELTNARCQIDEIDNSIWALLQKRFDLSREVARIKSNFSLPIFDEKREEEVLAKIRALSCDNEVLIAIEQIYKLVFELSRKCQRD